MEFPSTPLLEVLDEDAEIFVLCDEILHFESKAYELLGRRAHCYSNVEDLLEGLSMSLDGKLSEKRDNAFRDYYTSRPNTRKEFYKCLEEILSEESLSLDHA